MYMAPLFLAGKSTKCVPSRMAGLGSSRADKILQEMMAPTSVRFFNRMHWGQEDSGAHFRINVWTRRYYFSVRANTQGWGFQKPA